MRFPFPSPQPLPEERESRIPSRERRVVLDHERWGGLRRGNVLDCAQPSLIFTREKWD